MKITIECTNEQADLVVSLFDNLGNTGKVDLSSIETAIQSVEIEHRPDCIIINLTE